MEEVKDLRNIHVTKQHKDFYSYYLYLEKKFLCTENYVRFNHLNLLTDSNEFIALLQLIGAEVDVICKNICGYPDARNKNITDYKKDLLHIYPTLPEFQLTLRKFDIEYIQPFVSLNSTVTHRNNVTVPKSPIWWDAYNVVKHNRISMARRANLKNVLHALGGLYILNRLYMESTNDTLCKYDSELFTLVGYPSFGVVMYEEIGEKR